MRPYRAHSVGRDSESSHVHTTSGFRLIWWTHGCATASDSHRLPLSVVRCSAPAEHGESNTPRIVVSSCRDRDTVGTGIWLQNVRTLGSCSCLPVPIPSIATLPPRCGASCTTLFSDDSRAVSPPPAFPVNTPCADSTVSVDRRYVRRFDPCARAAPSSPGAG